jgi:8-oxo-dGTP pyrophosphatase MutT (NUDIX family)
MSSFSETTYNGIEFLAKYPEMESKLSAICKAPKVQKWIDRLLEKDELTVTSIRVTDVDFFGPPVPERLGFVKCVVSCVNKMTNEPISSNIVLIRGDSVCVYIVVTIRETQEKYVLFVEQIRVAGHGYKIELPAGMLDDKVDDSEILGPVFKEIKEETGFVPKKNELIQLGSKVHLSIGLLDEGITGYLWETTIDKAEFNWIQNNIYGEDANEQIKLRFSQLDAMDEFLDSIGDAKAEFCHRRYLARLHSRDNRLLILIGILLFYIVYIAYK